MNRTKFLAILTLICICFGGALLTDLPNFIKYQRGEIKDYDTVAAGELQKGDLVRGTIDMTEGCIAENEQTNSTFGIETSRRTTSQYYAVYMYNGNYILYETGNQEQYQTLDTLSRECELYFDALDEALGEDGTGDFSGIVPPQTTLEFTAVVKEIPDDLSAIFREWYGEGFNEECETVMLTYADFSRFLGMIVVGAVSLVLGIVFLILTLVSWKKFKQFSY